MLVGVLLLWVMVADIVSASPQFKPKAPLTCASVLCRRGYMCIDRGSKPLCVLSACPARKTRLLRPCVLTEGGCHEDKDCKGPQKCCLDGCNKRVCVDPLPQSCSPRCARKQKCVLKQVQCITEPCPPVRTCVDRKPQKPK